MTSHHDQETSSAALLLHNFAETAREEMITSTPSRKVDCCQHPTIVSPESPKCHVPLETTEILECKENPLDNFSTDGSEKSKLSKLHYPRSSTFTKMTKSFTLRPRSQSFKSSIHCFSSSKTNSISFHQRLATIPVLGCSSIYHPTIASKYVPDCISELNSSKSVYSTASLQTTDSCFTAFMPCFPVSPTSSKIHKKVNSDVKRVLRRKFSWKNYPELESFLVANREEYLHHSQLNYTLEQKQFNNLLTERLIKLTGEIGYEFDKTEFNFVAIRDRIRCYFKSYVQSKKKEGIIIRYKADKHLKDDN